MSDSDSDDDLLLSGPVFRKTARQERAADKKREKGLAFLETSLQEEVKRKALNDNITKIKQENWDCNEEELMTQAEETIAANNNEGNNNSKRKATEEDTTTTDNNNNSGLAALALRDQLATAVDTAQASSLGTRRVLSRGNAENQWSTVEFAKEELTDIVKRLQAQKGKQHEAFRKALVSLLKHQDHLEQVLLQRKLAVLCQKHEMAHLPNELTEWLFCLACNPIDGESSGYSAGAFQTLLTIWTRTHGTPKKPILTMQDMVRDMQAWFSLRLLLDSESHSPSANLGSTSTVVCVDGLEHFLLLWERALLNDIVALDESPEEMAKKCMVLLASASLDPCFYTSPGLLKALQRAICAFLAFVARNIVSDHSALKDWVASTVTAVLEQCKKLGAAAYSTDNHHDDDEMWLCLSLMARSVSTFDDCTSLVHDIHRQFRATLVIQALQMCLEIDDWDKHLQTVLSERGETELPVRASSSLAWRAIASTYAAFLTIPSLGSAVTKNGQRCLATVKLMTYCMLAGITSHSTPIDLVHSQADSDESNKGVLGTTQEASLFLRAVEVIESEGRQLASRVSCFSSDPNFSRAEYLLSCLRRYGDQVRLKARTISGQGGAGSPVSVQKSIHNYFGACSPES